MNKHLNIPTFLLIAILLFISCNKKDAGLPSPYETDDSLIKLTTLDDKLKESSGLVLVDEVIWTHNDSGGARKIYSIDENTGEIYEKVKITNASNIDWEDIAQDDTYLYIGDFGNNSGERQNLVIYKMQIDSLPEDSEAEKIHFIFPDQTSFNQIGNMHNYDCEAMITIEDSIYLFSKNHLNKETKVYRLPKEPGVYVADKVDHFDVDGLITGADLDEQTNTLCLLGYNKEGSVNYPFVWIFYDFSGTDFFGGKSKRINLSVYAQTEGICHKGNGHYLISSENEGNATPSLYLFDAYKWKQ